MLLILKNENLKNENLKNKNPEKMLAIFLNNNKLGTFFLEIFFK